MSETREMVCVACPLGCRLAVTQGEVEISVVGNRCPKGEVYGREEVLSPKRVVTAVVRTDSRRFPYLSVRTDKPLPRGLMGELLHELNATTVSLPFGRGAVLIESFRDSGVNVVASRTLPPLV